MSILRSGEMLARSEGLGWTFFWELVREVDLERGEGPFTGCEPRESPLRPVGAVDFFFGEGFERVIGMAESL
jgi:hypothetical protein